MYLMSNVGRQCPTAKHHTPTLVTGSFFGKKMWCRSTTLQFLFASWYNINGSHMVDWCTEGIWESYDLHRRDNRSDQRGYPWKEISVQSCINFAQSRSDYRGPNKKKKKQALISLYGTYTNMKYWQSMICEIISGRTLAIIRTLFVRKVSKVTSLWQFTSKGGVRSFSFNCKKKETMWNDDRYSSYCSYISNCV